MEAFILQYITQFTYIGIFAFLMLTVFGFPFPEDAVLILSGAVASQGVIKVMPTFWVAYTGVLAGDMLLYYIGRRYGRRVVKLRRFRHVLTAERLARAKRWFRRWGNPLIFFGRHIVGIRAQVLLCAGVFRLKAKRVLVYDSLSALISVPMMIFLGYYFGRNFTAIRRKVAVGHWLFAAAFFVVALALIGYGLYKKRRADNA